MKKVFLLITILSLSLAAMSQKGRVASALNYIEEGTLDKAKEAIDQALVDDKSKDWPNTYFAKGKLCLAVFESENPKFKAFYPEPLLEAYAAFEKSMELDSKGSMKKKIISTMTYNILAKDLVSQGISRFDAGEFNDALNSFETQIEVIESDKFVGPIDTVIYYNAGVAALNSTKYNEAIKYFEKCAEMKYQGITPYYKIYESYLGLGDTIKAESILTGLDSIFPDDKTIALQLIDLYLKSNKPNEVFRYLKIAKEAYPTNERLYLIAGLTYFNQNRYDEAIEELLKSLELKSDIPEALYLLGVSYINKGTDMFNKANDIVDINKYNAAIEEVNSVYVKAIPYLEKSLELSPEDIYTMRSLKELYYRLKVKDPSLVPKYDAIKVKLDALENN